MYYRYKTALLSFANPFVAERTADVRFMKLKARGILFLRGSERRTNVVERTAYRRILCNWGTSCYSVMARLRSAAIFT